MLELGLANELNFHGVSTLLGDVLDARNFSVLIVDDSAMIRKLLSYQMQKVGLKVLTAENGSEALNIIQSNTPVDIVLSDVMMPGISGVELLQEIRKHHSINDLPVIMITSLSEKEDMLHALSKGANDFLTKPVDFQVAVARIRTALTIKHTSELLEEQRARSSAQSSFKTLGEMASGMAHEMNNPAAILVATSQLLKKRLESDNTQTDKENFSRTTKMLDSIINAAKRISTVIKYLRDFSQPEEELEFEGKTEFAVSEFLSQLEGISMIKARNFEQQIQFRSEASEGTQIQGQHGNLSRAVFNVIDNALRANASQSKPVTVVVNEEDDAIKFTISDHGEGIPKELSMKVFDPFFTTRAVGEGMGMGLTTAKGIIEKDGGKIHHSRIGDKTVFELYLPLFKDKN